MIFTYSDISSTIFQTASDLGKWSLALAQTLFNWAKKAATVLRQGLADLLSWTKKLGADLKKLWRSHWFDGLRPWLKEAWKYLKEAYEFVKKWGLKVNKIIDRARRIYDQYWRKYIFPIINVISKIRQMMFILSLLHVSFAKKLDGYLAQLEFKIAQYSLIVREQLNRIAAVIDTILLAPSLFHPLVLLNSLAGNLRDIRNLLGARALTAPTAADAAFQEKTAHLASDSGALAYTKESLAAKRDTDPLGWLSQARGQATKLQKAGHL